MESQAPKRSEALQRFQELLRELFEFECADLDFGIYRIMNHKREIIKDFIENKLPNIIEKELSQGALAEQTRAHQELQQAAAAVRESLGEYAIKPDGSLLEQFRDTPVGKQYLEALQKATHARSLEAVETAIYNHLYTFFSRYWQDGDFISKRRYSKRERYAIPYNGEEVYLYWANHDQYYIKTAEHFTDYSYKAPNGVTVHFKLRQADVELNNVKGEKRFFLPQVDAIEWDAQTRTLTIPFEYRPLTPEEQKRYGEKNQQETIITEAVNEIPKRVQAACDPESLTALTTERRKTDEGASVSYLEHHLRRYTRRNTSDFFIHKDLKGFLSRELDFYLKNEVLNLDEMERAGEDLAEGWFQLLRIIKRIGMEIIEFLAQIENFQKMLWEKKKFVTETFYCITVGSITKPKDFYPEIAQCEAQWEEWKTLYHIHEESDGLLTADLETSEGRIEFLKAHPTLVLDTRHFPPDFTDRLLAHFENLDDAIDGLLVHSENWQALNLLQERYRERVKCIYIDPPYNTDASPIVYKNNYRSSSWISMMYDRLLISKSTLSEEGMICIAIDDFQQKELHHIVERIYGEDKILGTVVVRSNPSGRPGKKGFSTSHEYLIFAARSSDSTVSALTRTEQLNNRYKHVDERGQYMWELLRKRGSGSEKKDSPRLYFPLYVSRDGRIRVPEMEWDERVKEWRVLEQPQEGETLVYPIDQKGIYRRWRWSLETVRENLQDLKAEEDSNGFWNIYYKYRPPSGILPLTLWTDAKYSATEHGTNVLKTFFKEYNPFSFPKSIYATMDALLVMGGNKPKTLCLDFFAGSGTTGHAVINLNREDGGRRKFILVEMADYFDTVLLPRLKKVIFTPEWKEGKPKRMATEEEAKRSPRILKIIRLESYEDALNNLTFDEASGQTMLDRFGDEYLLRYMLVWETRRSETLLNVEKLTEPFCYKLKIHRDGETQERTVDLPETFNYLLGLEVQKRFVHHENGRRYLVYRGTLPMDRGTLPNGRTAVVIWRDIQGWTRDDFQREAKLVTKQGWTQGADEVYVNGDSSIPNAQSLDDIFKRRLFAPVEA
ncbi:site-specific DNA-methyltransferase [Synechococcus sp. RC10A2]|uniref:site-specific DNA-methyltransferase n=1 Tax=Synechococcus sp. RC10A2 TaxID=2964529 RepID=UPI0039C6A82E